VPAVEILRVTRSIQECIRHPERGHELKQLIEKGTEFGMQTFDQHLAALHKAGSISIEVARYAATSQTEFDRGLTVE
jgi:Tfp pilus assembly pilus retraction ATPase PilT